MKKRVALLFVLLALAAALLVAATRWFAARPLTGSLSFNRETLTPAAFQLDSFLIEWEPAAGGRLSISSVTNPEKILWQSLAGRAFVAAASGSETVTEKRAMFTLTDQRTATCARQQLDGFEFDGEMLRVRGSLTCAGGDSPAGQTAFTLAFSSPRANALRFELSTNQPTLQRLYLTFASERSEGFYGFGEQFSTLNMKGKKLPVFISEQGIGRGAQPITIGANLTAGAGGKWWTSYASVPWFFTSKLRALFLENSEYATFDLRRPDMAQIEVFSTRMTGQILNGETPAALIENYTRYSGRMRPLPDWINGGAVVGMQGGTARVREVLAQLQAHDTPIAAFWLQDWVGQRTTSFGKQLWWNWELDEERYPGWDALVSDLKEQNIHVMLYASPFLADVSEKTNARRNLYREAAGLGYLVKTPAGQPYPIQNTDFSAGLLDLTNPAAVAWFKTVLKENLIGAGASGWMADFGEGLPYDAQLSSAEPAASFHNRYPEDWAALNRAALDENGLASEGVFFTRSGFTRSPAHSTLFWTGDQLVSWDAHDGIKTAVLAMHSGGLSGFALNHSDIGGYTTIRNPLMNYYRSKELLLRWMEMNAFTVVYRTHEGNRPDDNAQFYSDEETLAHFARFARVYAALADYRKALYEDALEYGLPLVRHPLIQYPEDPQAWEITYQQFMLGSEWMIAPVLDSGKDKVRVYLPAGNWVHLWSGQTYGDTNRGIWVTVPAPLGQPGVFYLAGSKSGESLRQQVTRP